MSKSFKLGDVARLRSEDDLEMIVIGVEPVVEPEFITCTWYVEALAKYEYKSFPLEALDLIRSEAINRAFKVGDVVKVRTKDCPKMTITRLEPSWVHCTWYVPAEGRFAEDTFPPQALWSGDDGSPPDHGDEFEGGEPADLSDPSDLSY